MMLVLSPNQPRLRSLSFALTHSLLLLELQREAPSSNTSVAASSP